MKKCLDLLGKLEKNHGVLSNSLWEDRKEIILNKNVPDMKNLI